MSNRLTSLEVDFSQTETGCNGTGPSQPVLERCQKFLLPWRSLTLLLAVAIFPQLLVFVVHASRPSVDSSTFHESKARKSLERVAAEPHPYGSPADASVAELIEAHMRANAPSEVAQVEIQHFSRSFTQGTNVIGIVRGRQDGAAIMVSAHYDSVRNGPGATDDGSGVAVVLEAFRVLAAAAKEEPFEQDMIFALVDGEERGAVGSEYLVGTPVGQRARVIFNLEGSGAASKEYLIRTNSWWILSLYARHAPYPAAYSITEFLFTIFGGGYTDLIEYAKTGAHVVDFVFIENRFLYHTRDDKVDNVASGALQHEGANIYALMAHAASLVLPEAFKEITVDPIFSNYVYFTVMQKYMCYGSKEGFAVALVLLSTLVSLGPLFARQKLFASLGEALSLLAVICLGEMIQFLASALFMSNRDIRTWYWTANAVRVLHPLAWLSLIALTGFQIKTWNTDPVLVCTLLVGILVCSLSLLPDLAVAVMWLLLPGLVAIARSLICSRADSVSSHYLFAGLALVLTFDNVFAWIPQFLYYMDSMSLDIGSIELLASFIWILAVLVLWPLLQYLQPWEAKAATAVSGALVAGITLSELLLPFCESCPEPI